MVEEESQPYSVDCVAKERHLRELELDLGDGFREWMSPFVYDEPIQMLVLSEQAQRAVVESGMNTVGDIAAAYEEGFSELRGVGQGHIDEIAQKLKSYLKGRDLERAWRIDWVSLVRCVLGNEDSKNATLCCQRYGLENVFELTPAQQMDLRRHSDEQLEKMESAARAQLSTERRVVMLRKKLQQIVSVFVQPWMRDRGGFASGCQVKERISAVSEMSEGSIASSQQVLQMIEEVFGIVKPIESQLLVVDCDLYVSDHHVQKQYQEIMTIAKSYFYQLSVKYRMSELVTMIEKELAHSWDSYKEGFIEQVLVASPQLVTRKGRLLGGGADERVVRVNPFYV
jgi:hypothetical protein